MIHTYNVAAAVRDKTALQDSIRTREENTSNTDLKTKTKMDVCSMS